MDNMDATTERPVIATTTRTVKRRGPRLSRADRTPLGLWFWGKVWTLVAWCELRDDFRTFRIDRIARVVTSGRSFKPERGKQLADFYRRMERQEPGRAAEGNRS